MANKTFTIGKLMATRGVADKMNDCPEFERFARQLFIVVTHDLYIASFLAARKAVESFSRETWTRFLDSAAILVDADGTRRYALVRAGLSEGICGVGPKVGAAS